MSYSRQKQSHPQTFSDYITENNYLITQECEPPINRYKIHTHKRKSSQVSTLSYKSKNRNITSIDQLNHSLCKIPSTLPQSTRNKNLKSSKTSKKSLHKK